MQRIDYCHIQLILTDIPCTSVLVFFKDSFYRNLFLLLKVLSCITNNVCQTTAASLRIYYISPNFRFLFAVCNQDSKISSQVHHDKPGTYFLSKKKVQAYFYIENKANCD